MPHQPDLRLPEESVGLRATVEDDRTKQAAGQAGDEHVVGVVKRNRNRDRLVGLAIDHHAGARRNPMVMIDPQCCEPNRQIGVAFVLTLLDVLEHRMKGGIERNRMQDLLAACQPRPSLDRRQFGFDHGIAPFGADHAAKRRAVVHTDGACTILRSRQNPKILRRDDAEVVGYTVAVDVPLSRHLLAQERQHCRTEISERLVTSVVGDVPVHQSP